MIGNSFDIIFMASTEKELQHSFIKEQVLLKIVVSYFKFICMFLF